MENLKASEVKLSDAEFKALESALDSCKIYGHRGHIEVQGTVHKNNYRMGKYWCTLERGCIYYKKCRKTVG